MKKLDPSTYSYGEVCSTIKWGTNECRGQAACQHARLALSAVDVGAKQWWWYSLTDDFQAHWLQNDGALAYPCAAQPSLRSSNRHSCHWRAKCRCCLSSKCTVLKWDVVSVTVGALLSWGSRKWLHHWQTETWSKVRPSVLVLFKGCKDSNGCQWGWNNTSFRRKTLN